MSVLEVPASERRPYPSLGGEVCDWLEASLVFGPGDLRGQPYRLDDEKRRLVWRLYEVYPKDHPNAGRRRFRRAAISLRKGSAKALALDTPIPTPTGWTTIGWLSPGDLVFGSDGRPYPVTAISETWNDKPCYRVAFNDGTSIVASGDHRWATKTRREPRDGAGIFTTEEIRDSLFWHPRKPYANHRIPNAAPLVGEAVALPIEPYLLGMWLGDGTTLQPMLTVGAQDEAEMVAQLDSMGQGHSVYHYPNRAATVYLKRQKAPLRDAGLLGNKHIPPSYLRAPGPDRLALLQGLMDTDGSVSGRSCSYSSTSKRLAEGVLELVRSLGLRPYLMTGVARLNGEDIGPHYRVNFTPRDDVPVFRLKRKSQAAKRVARKVSQALCRTIRAVEPVAAVPVRCIAIDSPDHLFLAGPGMVPTHNTELGAAISAVELAPDGPVRCDGWRRDGKVWVPVGRPMRDPYIPMLAYTEEQSEELAYGALLVMLSEGPLSSGVFDFGLERIMRVGGDGKATALATAPDSRDGARTTFELFDETHRLALPRQKEAHRTMLANLPKRRMADAWALEVTTAPAPGEGSVAENTMDYARQVAEGAKSDARLYFFHRQASEGHDLTTKDGIRAAVVEASGPTTEWSDIDGIVEQWDDPSADRSYLARVWLNQLVRSTQQAFDAVLWKKLARPDYVVPEGARITLGFDGSRTSDATALIATEVASGFQWPLGIWQRPLNLETWEVPVPEVEKAIEDAFATYEVMRFYPDPAYWETYVAAWAARYGEQRVFAWWTYRTRPMAQAVRNYAGAMANGEVTHRGDPMNDLDRLFDSHIGNTHRRDVPVKDENGMQLWVIAKERSDSPHKMDAAMAGCLSWEARTDAIGAGALEQEAVFQVW